MIQLTRYDRTPVVVNADLIVYVDRTPDTMLTLTNGDRLPVRETVEEVIDRTIAYRRAIQGPLVREQG